MTDSPATAAAELGATHEAMALIELLSQQVGPRRPGSASERVAAELVRDALAAAGLEARTEPFAAFSTFAAPYGVIAALACLPGLLPRRRRAARAVAALSAAAMLVAEGRLRRTPLSALLARGESRNVIATLEPGREPERSLCLMAHVDSSRGGLLFAPRAQPLIRRWIGAQSVATLVAAAEPLLARRAPGRMLVTGSRLVVAAGLALLAERELRAADVPGANDNASGVATVVQLAAEAAASPPTSTRLVVLVCGAEEAGLLGSIAFLDSHETAGWLFVNFDGVAAPATLRYLDREGIVGGWDADDGLLSALRRIAAQRPELRLEPADLPLGLTYDATAVLARGGRAVTLVAGDEGAIPNYHQPSDTAANADPDTLGRALAIGRELIAAVDRGEADRVAA
jgi:hypothetical protein